MAKAKKVKENKVIAEVTHSGITENIHMENDGTITITPVETIIEEPIVGDEPPSVTLDEVEEVVEETPITEPPVQKVEEVKVISNEELTNEEKLLKFLESRDKGEIKLNDFLKSLYGVPKYNEPALWLKQSSSKEIRNMLDKLNKQGDYQVVNGNHLRLGAFYYPDTTTMKTEYHNLNTVPISVVKVN